jgi:hypothetical protein
MLHLGVPCVALRAMGRVSPIRAHPALHALRLRPANLQPLLGPAMNPVPLCQPPQEDELWGEALQDLPRGLRAAVALHLTFPALHRLEPLRGLSTQHQRWAPSTQHPAPSTQHQRWAPSTRGGPPAPSTQHQRWAPSTQHPAPELGPQHPAPSTRGGPPAARLLASYQLLAARASQLLVGASL